MNRVADLTPIEDLDRNILTLCTRINAATYELLVLVREFDERAGWVKWGLKNCAEWLAWRCDLSMATAMEKVRAAHALKMLPLISDAFSSGELSYSKVRALTRVANRNSEGELLNFALRHTTANVEARCRELRCGREDSIDSAARAYANRSLRIRRDRERSMMVVTLELPLDTGELIEKALDKARDDECLDIPDLVETSWSTRQAALAGGEGRSALPIESVKRLCCDSKAVVITENENGEPLSIGRKTRIVPTAIERALRARDNNCCTFPGCHNRRYLHSHHVEHWSNGGETNLDNLMSLCAKHHTLVHEGGFRIEKDYADRWYFMRPDGIAVPECGYVSRPYENPPRGGYLSVAEKSVSELPPPVYLH